MKSDIQRRGQATVEFVTMVGLLMLVVFTLHLLFAAFRGYSDRVVGLVGSEYP